MKDIMVIITSTNCWTPEFWSHPGAWPSCREPRAHRHPRTRRIETNPPPGRTARVTPVHDAQGRANAANTYDAFGYTGTTFRES